MPVINKTTEILRGQVWSFNTDPVKGSAVGEKFMPAIIVSDNIFNNGPADLVIVVPLTLENKNIPSHVQITPEDGGVKENSFAMCEEIQSISKERLISCWGTVTSTQKLKEIKLWVSDILAIDANLH